MRSAVVFSKQLVGVDVHFSAVGGLLSGLAFVKAGGSSDLENIKISKYESHCSQITAVSSAEGRRMISSIFKAQSSDSLAGDIRALGFCAIHASCLSSPSLRSQCSIEDIQVTQHHPY